LGDREAEKLEVRATMDKKCSNVLNNAWERRSWLAKPPPLFSFLTISAAPSSYVFVGSERCL
jgi:hypothetical protein